MHLQLHVTAERKPRNLSGNGHEEDGLRIHHVHGTPAHDALNSLLHVLPQLQLGDALALCGEDGGERGGVDVFDSQHFLFLTLRHGKQVQHLLVAYAYQVLLVVGDSEGEGQFGDSREGANSGLVHASPQDLVLLSTVHVV